MSYYVSTKIKEGKIILPKDFLSLGSDRAEIVEKEILRLTNVLEKEIEDMSAVTYKSIQDDISKLETELAEAITGNFYINKYGYKIARNQKSANELEPDEGVFITSRSSLEMVTAEGENASYKLSKNNGFILNDIGYTESNHGWVPELYKKLAGHFKCDVTFEEVTEEGDVDIVRFSFNDEKKKANVIEFIKNEFVQRKISSEFQLEIIEEIRKQLKVA